MGRFAAQGPGGAASLQGRKAVTDTLGHSVSRPVTLHGALTRALRRGHIRPF